MWDSLDADGAGCGAGVRFTSTDAGGPCSAGAEETAAIGEVAAESPGAVSPVRPVLRAAGLDHRGGVVACAEATGATRFAAS